MLGPRTTHIRVTARRTTYGTGGGLVVGAGGSARPGGMELATPWWTPWGCEMYHNRRGNEARRCWLQHWRAYAALRGCG